MVEAHRSCRHKAYFALAKHQVCIVSNTFTTKKEIEAYVDMVDMYMIITCQGEWKSLHDVPQATLEKMRNRWQYMPFDLELEYDPTDFYDRDAVPEKVDSSFYNLR